MLLVNTERTEYNLDEISRGTLIYAKHRSWPEGQTGIVTEASREVLRVQYLPSIQNVLNHFFIPAAEAESGEWEIRYSSDGLQNVAAFPEAPVEPEEKEEAGQPAEPEETEQPTEPDEKEGAELPTEPEEKKETGEAEGHEENPGIKGQEGDGANEPE